MSEILAYQMQHMHLGGGTAPSSSSWSSSSYKTVLSISFDSSSFVSLLSSSSMSSSSSCSYSSSVSSIVDSAKMSNCLQYRYPPQATESSHLSRSRCSNNLSSLGGSNCNTSSTSSVGVPRRSSHVAHLL